MKDSLSRRRRLGLRLTEKHCSNTPTTTIHRGLRCIAHCPLGLSLELEYEGRKRKIDYCYLIAPIPPSSISTSNFIRHHRNKNNDSASEGIGTCHTRSSVHNNNILHFTHRRLLEMLFLRLSCFFLLPYRLLGQCQQNLC